MNPPLIAITGGIGAGKSVVCRLLRTLGFDVFDCDSQAKVLMDSDDEIKKAIAVQIASEVINDGIINRALLSQIVFSDKLKLEILNNIVHGAVLAKIQNWRQKDSPSPIFVETAILYQSGLNEIVDEEWRVTAPENVRIERVMLRNAISAQQVINRIQSQIYTPAHNARKPKMHIIENDDVHPVIPQVLNLLSIYCPEYKI